MVCSTDINALNAPDSDPDSDSDSDPDPDPDTDSDPDPDPASSTNGILHIGHVAAGFVLCHFNKQLIQNRCLHTVYA